MARLREKEKIREANMELLKAALKKRKKQEMAPYKHGSWTPADDAQLAALLGEGRTYTEIAKVMDRTRGSIAGRAQRMKK